VNLLYFLCLRLLLLEPRSCPRRVGLLEADVRVSGKVLMSSPVPFDCGRESFDLCMVVS